MIDWVSLFFNALWIVGCSILLAQFSYRQWAKQQSLEGNPFNHFLISTLAYVLIGIGLVVVNEPIWQRLLWVLVTVLLIGSDYLSLKSYRS